MTTATTEAPTSAYPNVCTWTQEGCCTDGWATSCGSMFSIIDGTPSENGMKFCTYCGGVLVEVLDTPLADLEAEHFGDADKKTGIYAPAPDFGDLPVGEDGLPNQMASTVVTASPVAETAVCDLVQVGTSGKFPADEPATLKLGDINARLAPISISAAGLAELGIVHSATDKAAKLYRPSDFGRICEALVKHIERARHHPT